MLRCATAVYVMTGAKDAANLCRRFLHAPSIASGASPAEPFGSTDASQALTSKAAAA